MIWHRTLNVVAARLVITILWWSSGASTQPAWLYTFSQKCVKATDSEQDPHCEQAFIMKGCFDCNLGGRHKRTNCAGGAPVNTRTYFNQVHAAAQSTQLDLLGYYETAEQLFSEDYQTILTSPRAQRQVSIVQVKQTYLRKHHKEERTINWVCVCHRLWACVCVSSTWDNNSLV